MTPNLQPRKFLLPWHRPAGGGPVSKLELWIDGAVVQTVEAAPWTLTWAAAPGQHTLAIRAVGPRGNATADVRLVDVPVP